MFCTSLRRRASFTSSVQSLTACLHLRESQLSTHDLEIPYRSNDDPRSDSTSPARQLRVLLLSPSAVSEPKLDATFKRIQHFASLTGGEDLAIVFLLAPPLVKSFVTAKRLIPGHGEKDSNVEGIHGYSKLQAETLNHSEIPYVPILPLCKPEGLADLLKKHIMSLTRPPPKQKAAATSFELLQLCTANPPMSQQAAFILTDLFTDLRDLARVCSSVGSAPSSSSPTARLAASQETGVPDLSLDMSTQGSDSSATNRLKRLRDLVGDQECQAVIDFWKEEWTVD
ncbi:hypothetical protein LTR37_004679 [Vermiconidia calcicola]|uniref:Uncharacterized protein n=1 Tax=Vermiconidia calcicola TaxID=1690605 RepID=A0ACC3NLN1_9PEZI|nr:hypothetical protein LTR37_004679 [Vermiconidia calcicola]